MSNHVTHSFKHGSAPREPSVDDPSQGLVGLYETIPAAVLLQRQGQLIHLNRCALRELRYERRDEVVGCQMTELVHVDDRSSVTARVGGVGDCDFIPPPHEVRLLRRDGSTWIAEMAYGEVVFRGEPAVVVVACDVAGRRSENTDALAGGRHGSVGILATAVVQQAAARLPFIQLMLKHAESEIGGVLCGLGPRRGEALTSGTDSAVIARLAHAHEELLKTSAALDHIRQLMRDVALVAPQSVPPDQRVVVELAPCIEAAIRLVGEDIQRRARLVTDISEGLVVRADPGWLCLVFVELLQNAAQAIPAGMEAQSEIRVVTRIDQAGVRVEFRDNGCGIPPENCGRIFEPFFTTKPLGMGTGLGLFRARSVVTALGGTIGFTSEVGKGTVFHVILPAVHPGLRED